MGQVIGAALTVASGIASAAGAAKADSFKANQAAEASRYGKIQAAQTDASVREELSTVIGNVRAIRASAGVDPNSPTTAAITANDATISERQRRTQVGNILEQSNSDAASSKFLNQSSGDAFLYGTIGSLGKGISTLSGQ